MADVRCPYCHEYVDSRDFPAHQAAHVKDRGDGQQSEYATLPPEDREEGDLTGVPRVYVHRKCGGMTGMPEEIIRSYLKNPHMYSGDTTFCCGCATHVPDSECVWVETGEDLQTYMNRLRVEKPLPPLTPEGEKALERINQLLEQRKQLLAGNTATAGVAKPQASPQSGCLVLIGVVGAFGSVAALL